MGVLRQRVIAALHGSSGAWLSKPREIPLAHASQLSPDLRGASLLGWFLSRAGRPS